MINSKVDVDGNPRLLLDDEASFVREQSLRSREDSYVSRDKGGFSVNEGEVEFEGGSMSDRGSSQPISDGVRVPRQAPTLEGADWLKERDALLKGLEDGGHGDSIDTVVARAAKKWEATADPVKAFSTRLIGKLQAKSKKTATKKTLPKFLGKIAKHARHVDGKSGDDDQVDAV